MIYPKTNILPYVNIITNPPNMVALASIGCLSGNNGSFKGSPIIEQAENNHLGILAFEAARTVSRLLNLYKSLSDSEIIRLRKDIFKSKGVVYLNSDDEAYLLKLTCAEKIEDLDKAAIVVDRLGRKCSDFMLKGFDLIYADVKTGSTDLRRFEYGSSKTKKKIRKLKRFLSSTLNLYGSMQGVTGSEVSERKLNSPVPFKNMINFPAIEWKITPYKKQSCEFKKQNLWTQPFEKVVRLMSRIVCVIYARICMVFGPYVPDLPEAYRSKQKQVTNTPSEYWIVEPRNDNKSCSRPRLIRSKSKKNFLRFHSRKTRVTTGGASVFHTAGPDTVGGSRLQILYANLIMMAEENMTRKKLRDDVRDEMYRMLPEILKATVKMKIRRLQQITQSGSNINGEKGKIKEALRRIFMWLSPMATNTLLWQRERRVEMTSSSFQARPPVLLLQTLHFADKEKTEAAIVEVLVGLSYLYMNDNRGVSAG